MTAQFATLEALSNELKEMGGHSAEYWAKQVHVVAKSSTVDRVEFLVKLCTGKTILHVGCTGRLDDVLREAATRCYGIDKGPKERPDYQDVDLDHLWSVPLVPQPDVEVIVCGEVLEHLSNPGQFLAALHAAYPTTPVVITVPNAFSDAGRDWLVKRGRENVHRDHVAYYSITTLTTLLSRYQYRPTKHYWYGGSPYLSEGLILLATPTEG